MPPVRREERILNLLSALLAARTPLPFSEIRGKVTGYDDAATREALDKRFDRDKGTLRKLGVPLEFVSGDEFGRSGYRISREGFFLAEIRFTVEEGIVLAALHRAVARGPAVQDGLTTALAKLGVDSPLSEAFRESVGEQQLLDPRIPPEREKESERLAALAEALAARRPVRFSYYSLGSGETRQREVSPYGIGYHRGHWYLAGLDREVSEERVYRTSRIRGRVVILAASGYAIPEGFSLRDRIERRAWELKPGEKVTVETRFEPDVAWMIAEHVRPGQSFRPEEDGGGVLTLQASDPEKLVGWVAHHGASAEVRSPARLREATIDFLQAAPVEVPAMTTSSLDQLRKVLAILPLVQANQGIRVSELSRMSGIPEEEIVGDLPRLVNLCGVPPYSPPDLVDLEVDGDKVSIRFAEQFRRPVRLTLREAMAVEMALAGWETGGEGPFGAAVASIRKKVRAAYSPEAALGVKEAGERISASAPMPLAARMAGRMKEALSRQVEARIEYLSQSRGTLSERTIRPYGLYEQRGHWYVVGHSLERREIRTFRMDRLRSATLTDREYEIPDEFEVGDYCREGPVQPEERTSFTAKIRFEPEVARFAREWFPATAFRTLAGGALRAEVRTASSAWLVSEVLRWGPAALVEEPESLAREVVEEIDRAIARYGR